ncbi:3-dehydro-L-gulonate 2-dehydrogenase [Pontibacter akesuensis]|uniref:3-dehydro-L-gulonate 2-dehydrogenase n=1 Tax=Pontibacter akesuensis TaxID=388950 RepID=A0A1I7HTQ0_9BACT|nr:3-dehydro-L-gulonate 2-dehydrogenase [Pontibacter akesuensis]GHA63468.1 2,3-diketo-L-gulonate reductase [Pontibacter akesuensis]SFU63939.1 3-dehydro-L-gulonate 2-dehydrogenase [Pontibacter akesuensis]
MKVSFEELKAQFNKVLLKNGFNEERAELCARVFAENSRDGVYSHGLNRFPVFVQLVKDGLIKTDAEPECTNRQGVVEQWDGHMGPGMYVALKATERAIALAKENGMGCVAVRNTNHWMRGGTYGWQAADEGCVCICATNSIANMPPFGGKEPRLGNNPLVIAVPRKEGHLVLDMAISQFSYGKMQEYELKEEALPVDGGYDAEGNLTKDPGKIRESERPLPIGFWKGSGLSFMLDVLVAALSNGRGVAQVTDSGSEAGVSQFFLCINAQSIDEALLNSIVNYTKSSAPADGKGEVRYPGEGTLNTRRKSEQEGIHVSEEMWQKVLEL